MKTLSTLPIRTDIYVDAVHFYSNASSRMFYTLYYTEVNSDEIKTSWEIVCSIDKNGLDFQLVKVLYKWSSNNSASDLSLHAVRFISRWLQRERKNHEWYASHHPGKAPKLHTEEDAGFGVRHWYNMEVELEVLNFLLQNQVKNTNLQTV